METFCANINLQKKSKKINEKKVEASVGKSPLIENGIDFQQNYSKNKFEMFKTIISFMNEFDTTCV